MVLGDLTTDARKQTREEFIAHLGGDVLLGSADPHQSSAWVFETVVAQSDEPTRPVGRMLRGLVVVPIRRARSASRSDVVLVGRAMTNDITIPDESVSKLHARFHLPGPTLVDAGSKSGTWYDDKPIKPGEAVEVRHGRTVQFGRIELRFYRAKRLYDLARQI